MYVNLHPEQAARPGFELLGGDQAWELPTSEYMSLFTAPLPEANYGTMVVSTAGHWTVGTFHGLRDDSMAHQGMQNVMDFFGEAMQVWSGLVQGWLHSTVGGSSSSADTSMGGGRYTKGGRKRQVVIRAYLPGHDGCHDHFKPWTWYEQGIQSLSYNWGQIPALNRIFEVCCVWCGLVRGLGLTFLFRKNVLDNKLYNDVHFLPIDRPALLRPDAVSGWR